MARDPGFEGFSRRMAIKAQVVGNNAEQVVRRAAVAADTALVITTPIDTGRAKGNWTVSIGSIDDTVQLDGFPSPEEAMRKGQQVVNGWRLGAGTLFIANSLPYIVPLENGHSRQAPAGMVQHGVAAALHQIRNASLLR